MVGTAVTTLLIFKAIVLIESKPISQNDGRTMHFYILPMTQREAELVQRQSRQQQGTQNTGTLVGVAPLPPAGTAINVANILTGLFKEDVRPILSGGTAFIPQGDLREGVVGLLQGFAPALQQILFGGGSSLPVTDYTIPTAAPVPRTEPPTSPPQHRIRRTTTVVPQDFYSSPIPEEISEEETESTDTATLTSTHLSLPPAISTQPTTTSAESDEETESPATTAHLNSPGSATPASPQVNDPRTEKASAVVPESAQSRPESQLAQASNQPESAPPPVQAIIESPATQLKVVLEDTNSIVTANVVSNAKGDEKQYIYLVLLPEQYEQFDKLTASSFSMQKQENLVEMTQTPLKHPELLSIQEESIEPDQITSTSENLISIPVSAFTTVRSGGYRLRNKNGTLPIPPPHLQLQYYYQLTSSTTTTTTTSTTTSTPPRTASTDLPGVKGFENEDDELDS